MGFALDAYGKPVYNQTPQTVLDLQAGADFANTFANVRVGSKAERDALLVGQLRAGMLWSDSAAGAILQRVGTEWDRIVSFRTYTTSRAGMTDGVPFIQVPTEDNTKDTEPAFDYSYNSGTGVLLLEAGVYMISGKGHPGGVTTGLSFMQFRAATRGVFARGPVIDNADPWMTCAGLFRSDGVEGFLIEIRKATGGASSGQGVLDIAKISNL